jgi:hypothetical protein
LLFSTDAFGGVVSDSLLVAERATDGCEAAAETEFTVTHFAVKISTMQYASSFTV